MSTDRIQALEAENADLRAALSDLRYGAQMIAGFATGSFARFASEVERVATAALNNTTTETTPNV